MTATVDNWTGPGSGGPTVAPNTYWWTANATSQTVKISCKFYNASGGLVTVNCTVGIWDVTSGSSLASSSFTGVNSVSIGPNTMTNGHIYTFRIQFNGGTSCDHCVFSVASIGSNTSGHPVCFIRRSGAWVGVPGHQIRIRRGGVWVPVNGGVYFRRSGVWNQP